MKRSPLWFLGGLLLASAAQAQSGMVQPIRPSGAENLSRHLARLASNPRNVDALIGAGDAALSLDDTQAAAGFFARADAIQPSNARVKAGLARVMLKTQNPAEALRLFDQASRLGISEADLLADRGLARDMTGDQPGAQRDYQAALRRTPEDADLIYRYAASLGISGQVEAAEKILQPLLYKGDRAAWRYRAFILAMNNRQADARKIASQTLPAQMATALVPYMEKMPYLTAAQKAAAVHFGHFPANVSAVAAAPRPMQPAPPAIAPAASAPAAQPTAGTRVATRAETARSSSPARASPSVSPSRQPAVPPQQPLRTADAQPASIASNVQGPPSPFPSAAPAPAPSSALNAASSAQVQPSRPAAVTPAAPPQPSPEATRTLADIIHAIDVPEAERRVNVAAVDLQEIEAIRAAQQAKKQAAADAARKAAAAEKAKVDAALKAKAKAEADAKAKKAAEEKARLAANPSRNWVQVGTGSDRSALAFTLKGLRRKYDDVTPQDGWVASWGRTNRLLIGPFASFTRAKAVETKLKAAGADAFAWQSDAGEVVERFGGK